MNSLERGCETDPSPLSDGAGELNALLTEPARIQESSPVARLQTHDNLEDEFRELKRTQSLLLTEKRALEMINDGASVAEIMESLCARFDAESSDFMSSILLMEPDGKRLRFGAGARVPKEWGVHQSCHNRSLRGLLRHRRISKRAGDRFGYSHGPLMDRPPGCRTALWSPFGMVPAHSLER